MRKRNEGKDILSVCCFFSLCFSFSFRLFSEAQASKPIRETDYDREEQRWLSREQSPPAGWVGERRQVSPRIRRLQWEMDGLELCWDDPPKGPEDHVQWRAALEEFTWWQIEGRGAQGRSFWEVTKWSRSHTSPKVVGSLPDWLLFIFIIFSSTNSQTPSRGGLQANFPLSSPTLSAFPSAYILSPSWNAHSIHVNH